MLLKLVLEAYSLYFLLSSAMLLLELKLLSVSLLFERSFTSSSFSSTNERNVWRRSDLVLFVEGSDLWGWCLQNWRTIFRRYTRSASKQANPHMRKRPQKLLSWSRSTSSLAPCKLQGLLISHLSCILCRSPFSESFKIAVDMSTANGESWGNACPSVYTIIVIIMRSNSSTKSVYQVFFYTNSVVQRCF